MTEFRLCFDHVSVGYGSNGGQRVLLRDVDFELRPGEVFGLIGPNGSGKTTLVRSIFGGAKVVDGRITYHGQSLPDLKPRERAKIVSLVPQHHIVPEGFTVFDVAAMGRTVTLGRFGRLSWKDRERIDAALQLAGADPLRERLCCRLSGGEQQRVLLARALAQDTPIMVLDEPTAFLDLHYQVHILELVRSISRTRSVGVLLILHDLNLASRYTDRLMILSDGRVVDVGETDSVMDASRLSEVYRIKLERIERSFPHAPIFIPEENPAAHE